MNSSGSSTVASGPPYLSTYSCCTCAISACAAAPANGSSRSSRSLTAASSSGEMVVPTEYRPALRVDPRPRAHPADGGADVRQVNVGGDREGERVVLATGEQVVIAHAIGAEPAQRVKVDVDTDAAGGCNMSEIGGQSVTHIDHRGRPADRNLWADVVRRFRAAERVRQRTCRDAGLQCTQTGGRPAEPSCNSDDVTDASARTSDRRTPAEVTECCYRDRHEITAHEVTADNMRVTNGGFVAEAVGETVQPVEV